MRRRNEELDLVSAVAGTAGALEVAGRYLLGGVRTARRRIGRTVKHARHLSHSDATRAGMRAVTAVQVLRGTIPERRVRPVSMLGAATAGVVFGVVTAFGIRAVTRVLVSGGPVVTPAPDRERVTA
jgi:hypothetical protein